MSVLKTPCLGIAGRASLTCIAVAAALVLPTGSLAQGVSASGLPLFEASAPAPAVQRVVGRLKAQVCRVNVDSDAQTAATSRLREKATAMGATAIVDVRFKMTTSRVAFNKNGFPNSCRFETDAKGTAVILAGGAPG